MRGIVTFCFSVLLCLASLPGAFAGVLFQDAFEKGAPGWTATDQAVVSDISRRPGMKSLVIRQWKDSESDSAWLSPAIKNTGKPVKLSFWAVGNYLTCTDFSYSGCMDVVNYAPDGKDLGGSVYMLYIPWDDTRTDAMWGKLLPGGFVWRYFSCLYTPSGDTFRLKFHWPKAIVRGDCYLTDVQVAEATAEDLAATPAKPDTTQATKAPETNLVVELTAPVSANLFYQADPIRFNALLYTKDGQALILPADAKLVYDITDFLRMPIAAGEVGALVITMTIARTLAISCCHTNGQRGKASVPASRERGTLALPLATRNSPHMIF